MMNSLGAQRRPFLFILDFLLREPQVLPLEDVDPAEILYDIDGCGNEPEGSRGVGDIHFTIDPVPFAQYCRAFEQVQGHLQNGDTYLLNLTFPTRLHTTATLADIHRGTRARYRLLLRDRCVVFSPETFVRIRGGRIESCPMKGTIDAAIPDAARIILADAKETAEHVTIVDLIRNDLSMIAERVRVEDFRYIDHIHTNRRDLLQVSSRIVGDLRPDWHASIGDIMMALLPAGSISGAPKRRTVEIILEAECCDRGLYTGVVGVFDGTSLDSGVMIRFIEAIDGRLYYKSGGGITALSDPEGEYRELIDKVYVPPA